MKKIITTIGAMLITTLSWAQLTGITLSGGNMISATGGNFDIAVATSGTLTGMNTLMGVNWSVNNGFATLTGTALDKATINAVNNGTVTVTAVAFTSSSTVTGRLVVTVSNQINALTLSGASTLVASNTGDVTLLTVTSNLSAAVNASNLSWSVTPNSLAGVSGFNLQAKGNGVVNVTAMSKADNTVMSNTITVTLSGFVPLASVTISGASNSISTLRGKVRLTSGYSPSNATAPVLSWTSSDNCIADVSGTPADVTGKRNGVVTITGTYTNGDGSVSAIYVITVSGQKAYHETFQGSWDSNPYTKPSTFDPRTGQIVANSILIPGVNGFPSLGVSYYAFKNNPTVNQLDYTITNASTTFDTDGPFWNGTKKITFGLVDNMDTEGKGGGCGIDVSIYNTISLEVENKGTATLSLQLTAHDQSFGGFFGGDNGVPYVVTVPAMTRKIVTQVVPNSFAAVKLVGVRVANFTGDFTIYSLTVGAGAPTGVALSSSVSITGIASVSGTVSGTNVVDKIVYKVLQSKAGLVNFSTTGNVLNLVATGSANGLITVIGTAFNSTVSSMSVITVTNQVVDGATVSIASTTVATSGTITFTGMVMPATLPQGISWVVSPSSLGGVSLNTTTGAYVFKASTVTGIATITGTVNAVNGDFLVRAFTITVTPPASISSAIEASSVTIFPNPAADKVSIAGVDVASVILVNTLGQVVATSGSASLSIAGIPAGLYKVLIYTTSGGSVSKTLIKE